MEWIAGSASVSFTGALPGTVVKATTILRSPVTANGEMIIPSITIAGVTKLILKLVVQKA